MLIPVLLCLAVGALLPYNSSAEQVTAEFETRHAAALEYIANDTVRDEKVMIPMRDGIRLSALILYPKDRPKHELPAILFRSPYLIDPDEIERFAEFTQSFIANGYAVVIQNVRGRYYSEGTYTYLIGSGNDGYDTVEWITNQKWSNGRVGTLGCSSTAEEQHRLNGMQHPGLAATVPVGSGAGIGKVGPYNEMGNFYRGGVVQNFWFSWYYRKGYTYRPQFSNELSRETLIRLSRFWNMDPAVIPPSGIDKRIWTLPINEVMSSMGAVPSDMDDFVNRLPNDPRWKDVEFGDESDHYGAPMLIINSWYDVSIGPNVAMYEYQSKNAANANARNNMFMIIAPTTHCQQGTVESEQTIIGQRDMGDARFDYVGTVQKWFDYFVKGIKNDVTGMPKVQTYMMGANEWRAYDIWPPENVTFVSYFLDSDGNANSLNGDGRLSTAIPSKAGADSFTYDPLRPVPSLGGSICCFSDDFVGGSFDQGDIEIRNDVLIYQSPALKKAIEITGPVSVSLYLSSDVRDTDLTVKLVDVHPDGKAYNLDETIQRVRWRDGWERPVFMESNKIYKVDVGPLVTSNSFLAGHRIRIEVSSSNFPRFERNLNTGGNNYDEKDAIIAHNTIHHSPDHPSVIVLPIVN